MSSSSGGFHIYLSHFSSRSGLWVYAVPSFITLGHGLASRKRVISIRLFFFERGYHTFLAGHRKDPEKTIRKGPELPLFLASSSLWPLTGSYWSPPLFCLLLPPSNSVVGNHIVPLYPEEQQYSRDAWGYTALGDAWVFSSLVLYHGYIQSTARGNLPILERHWVISRGRNTYGFGSLRRRRT